MKKSQKLKIERRISGKLTLLPQHVSKILDNFYIREVDEIERYGASDPEVDSSSIDEISEIIEETKKG